MILIKLILGTIISDLTILVSDKKFKAETFKSQ